jgi:hypothetical protein
MSDIVGMGMWLLSAITAFMAIVFSTDDRKFWHLIAIAGVWAVLAVAQAIHNMVRQIGAAIVEAAKRRSEVP